MRGRNFLQTVVIGAVCLALGPACSRKKNNLTIAPSVASVSPEGGPIAAGQTITILGENFDSRASVEVGGLNCPTANVSSTRITCVLPAMAMGWKAVKVTNPPLGSVYFRSYEASLSNGYAAGAVAVNQPSFTSRSLPAENAMRNPSYLGNDGTNLMVSDASNARLLVWNAAPSSTANPNFSLGTADLNLIKAYDTPYKANAAGVCSDGTRLVVADSVRHRVLVWNEMPEAYGTAPAVDGAAADFVLGQAAMTGADASQGATRPSAQTIYFPLIARVMDGKLWVADGGNNRLLAWSSVPTSSGAAADFVWGQADFTSASANRGSLTPGLKMLLSPYDMLSVGDGRMAIAAPGNNRVLIIPNPY